MVFDLIQYIKRIWYRRAGRHHAWMFMYIKVTVLLAFCVISESFDVMTKKFASKGTHIVVRTSITHIFKCF